MKVKKSIIVFLFSLTLLFCCTSFFIACDSGNDNGAESDNVYTVAFKVDGKNYDIALVKEGKTVVLPTELPSVDGYTFDGWFTDKDYTQAFNENAEINQDVFVYAKLTPITYNIIYQADGGTHDNVNSFTVEDKVILFAATKNGYAFEGWYMDGYRVSYIPKGTCENVTLTAKYIKNGYDITYENVYGAENLNPNAYSIESDDIVLTEPYLSGYEFKGWFNNEELQGEPITVIPKGSTGNLTLYAKFELIVCNVTFSGADGCNNEYNELDPTYSAEKYFYLSDVSKEGYTFDGWFDEYDIKVEYLPVSDYYVDITLTAKWTPIEYKIDYKNLNGADNSQNPVTYTIESGEFEIADLADTLDYDFKGWSFMNCTPEKDFVFNSSAAFDATLVAVWEQKEEYKGLDYYVSPDESKVIIVGVTDVTLKNVTVPDETVMILKGAFKNLTSLKSISLPFVGKERTVSDDSTLSYLFDGEIPSTLKTVTISGGETIPEEAFKECQSIENVIITGNVTTIGQRAFYNCHELEILDIRANVTTIGNYAFYDCVNLLQVKLPASLTEIKTRAFSNCNSLIEVYNPSRIEIELGSNGNGWIGYYTKYLYTSLDETSRLYHDVEGNLFYNSEDGLIFMSYKSDSTEYVIPSNVEIIYDSAFKGREDVTNVTLPSSLKKIGNRAFEKCNAIVSLDITTEGLIVGDNAFNGSTALTSVTVSAQNVSIGNGAFKNCANLSTIALTGKGMKVGNEAFTGCKQKTALEISAENSEFGLAFKNWNELKTLTVSAKNSKFTGTFIGTSLEEVTISGNGVVLVSGVFSGVSTLKKVSFTGNGIVLEGDDNFRNCTSLTEILFQGDATSIGGYSFYHCTALETLTFGSGLKTIGASAFEGCTALKNVTFNDDLISIGNNAFLGCVKLTEIEFPTTLESIENEAFKGLTSLTKIEFPQSLSKIGDKAFADCSHLRQVEFPNSISIGNEVFSGCILSEVILPAEITYTNSSFKNCCNDNVATLYYYGTSAQIKSASDLGLGGSSKLYYYKEVPEYNDNNSAFKENYWHYDAMGKIETGDSKTVTFGTTYAVAPNSGSSIDALFDGKKSADGLYLVQVNSISWRVEITVWLSRAVALKSFTITTGRGADYKNRVPNGFRVTGGTVDGGSVTILDKYGDDSALPKENYKSVKFDGQADGNTLLNTLSFTFAMPNNRDEQNNMELAEIELEFWEIGWNDVTFKPLSYKAIDGNGSFVFATDNNYDTSWSVSPGRYGAAQIILEADNAFALGSYALKYGSGHNGWYWSLYGSNDDDYFASDDKWTLLDTVSGNSWGKENDELTFYLDDNKSEYKYYKFYFSNETARTDFCVSLKELKISSDLRPITYEAVKGTEGGESENYNNLTDGDKNTKWCVNVSSNKNPTVIIKALTSSILKEITITNANDSGTYTSRNPLKVSIWYSDDSNCTDDSYSGWKQLSQSEFSLSFPDGNFQSCSLSLSANTEAHRYYRFTFTAQDDATAMQLSEITLELEYAN